MKKRPSSKRDVTAISDNGEASSAPTPTQVQPRAALASEILTMPSAQNGRVLQAWARLGEIELGPVVDKLREASKAVVAGEMKQVEAMLFDQAVALQAIFTNLSIEAANAQHLDKLDPLLRLALKAQSQARATLETLANIKNPPVVYARQANIANGPQQVNNGMPGSAPAPAAIVHSSPTELFEETRYGNGMDAGTQGEAGGTHSHLATLGAVDRAEDRAGQGAEQEQPLRRCGAASLQAADARAARGNGRTAQSARSAISSSLRPRKGRSR